mmetsp:Transcript_6478/g.10279  ORF Transcript_6478/g.10279 Transcript_6478/m.10279 type:complete len:85 (+) Transcript_6478:2570-2824(+)
MCILVPSIAPAQVYHVQQQDECRCISNILYTMLQRAVYYYCQPFEMTEFVTSMKEMRQTSNIEKGGLDNDGVRNHKLRWLSNNM